jgi:hypothetical protein
MNKYTVILSGTGIEAYLFSLDSEKFELAESIDFSNFKILQILADLGIEDPGSADMIITGLLEDETSISVYDESNKLVYSSYRPTLEKELFRNGLEDETLLINENKIKGDLLSFEFYADEFDESNLGLALTEIGYRNIITCIKWKEEYLEINTDFLDWESVESNTYLIS